MIEWLWEFAGGCVAIYGLGVLEWLLELCSWECSY